MKNQSIVIVEHIGESGVWEWYSLHKKLNEREAIEQYCKEMSLPCGKIIEKRDEFNNAFYSEKQDVRAYKAVVVD